MKRGHHFDVPRGSHQRRSVKKSVLRNFRKFTRKHLCQSLLFNKKRLWHRCFPVNLAKFLSTNILQNTSGRLLLRPFPKFFKAVSKQYIVTKQQKTLSWEPCIFFKMKSLIFRHFLKIWKFNNPCDVIRSKLGQKGTKFLY